VSFQPALEAATEALDAELDPKWNIKVGIPFHSIVNSLTFAKVTLLQLGGFKTRILETSPQFPAHPAYTDPTLMGNIIRDLKDNGKLGDPDKATHMLFHKLANDPEPSLRVAVGPDSNSAIKNKLKRVEADITKYESWSDDLS